MDDVAAHFWEGCASGEIRYQHCCACGKVQFFPRPFCATCGSDCPDWACSRGFGVVYAATIVGRAPIDEFKAVAPYGLVLIDLEEGFRMMAHGDATLRVGECVKSTFRRFGDRLLPFFEHAPAC